jgi:hypothetical protein
MLFFLYSLISSHNTKYPISQCAGWEYKSVDWGDEVPSSEEISLINQSQQIDFLAPHRRGFYITHSDAPQSVGLLWTGGQLVAETST